MTTKNEMANNSESGSQARLWLGQEPFSPRKIIKRKIKTAATVFGSFLQKQTAEQPVILMYHSIAEERAANYIHPSVRISPQLFEQHLLFIKKNFDVLSIDDCAEIIESGEMLSPKALILSFDDGYLDNLEVAMHILDAYNFPAVFYLATRYIDESTPQWVDRMYSIFKYRKEDRIELEYFQKRNWNLSVLEDQIDLFAQLNDLMISRLEGEREELLETLASKCKFEEDLPRLTLTWEEVEKISRTSSNIILGVHTDGHLDVNQHDARFRSEMTTSINKLENVTGKTPIHFSFPYGRAYEGAHRVLCEFEMRTAVCSRPPFRIDNQWRQYYLCRVDAVEHSHKFWKYVG